jgi:hypothetical protein
MSGLTPWLDLLTAARRTAMGEAGPYRSGAAMVQAAKRCLVQPQAVDDAGRGYAGGLIALAGLVRVWQAAPPECRNAALAAIGAACEVLDNWPMQARTVAVVPPRIGGGGQPVRAWWLEADR